MGQNKFVVGDVRNYTGPLLNGWYGIVAIPDPIICDVALRLATAYRRSTLGGFTQDELLDMNPDAEIEGQQRPLFLQQGRVHITLLQSRLFRNMPLGVAMAALEHLDQNYRGARIKLERLSVARRQYLFWNASGFALRDAHRDMFPLAEFLNREEIARIVSTAVNPDFDTRRNLERFGLEHVDKKYAPHITLAYREQPALPTHVRKEWPQEGVIDRFAFCRHGKGGVITEYVALSR